MSKTTAINKYHLELLFPILLLSVLLAIASPHFATLQNINNVGNQIAINIIIGLGMTILISSNGIDLSVGSNVALTGVFVAQFFQNGMNDPVSVVFGVIIGLTAGALVGLLNGAIVAYLKVPPFICTLGTQIALRGLALVFSGGRPIMGMPDEFLRIFAGFTFGIPRPVITAFVVIIITAFLFNKTTFGRRILAIGGNERCVKICGTNVEFIKLKAYCLMGALAGLAGIVLASTMATAEPLSGQWYELDAIAVVVMGGTSLKGGKGTIVGTILGALFLGLVRNGLNLLKIHANYHTMIVGLLILLSIILTSDFLSKLLDSGLIRLKTNKVKEGEKYA